MTTVQHEIRLTSSESFHGELPPRSLGLLLAEIQPLLRASVAMAFRNRSNVRGKSPGWLERCADVRFLGFDGNGTTNLRFLAPQLNSVAGELYQQPSLFGGPPPGELTAFDLLAETVHDVERGDKDSEKFDTPLLQRLSRFSRVFDGPFTGLELFGKNSGPCHLTPEVLQTARTLSACIPQPRRVRVVGVLDTVSESRQAFVLRMAQGEMIRGVLLDCSINEFAKLFGQSILVLGKAHYRPSGALLRIDTDEFRLATDADNFFAKTPEPFVNAKRKFNELDKKRMAEGLKSIFGKWPGDETDEECEAALRELS